jgi:hypothetical protein
MANQHDTTSPHEAATFTAQELLEADLGEPVGETAEERYRRGFCDGFMVASYDLLGRFKGKLADGLFYLAEEFIFGPLGEWRARACRARPAGFEVPPRFDAGGK